MAPQLLTAIIWIAFMASWLGAAFWSDRAAKQPPTREAWLYRILTTAGIALLVVGGSQFSNPAARWWTVEPFAGYALVLVVLAGVAFTWWGRIYLGRLWSSSVTSKVNHRVVDTGPYAIVRHPIYTGIILGAAASAIQIGTPLAIAGALLLGVGFWVKARLEEGFLRGQFGAGEYDAYRRKVPMLVPFGPLG